ncbi:Cell division protein FtsI [Peptidoglycan synthetase] [Alloactinosynnema sp. L-07]|uniref:penicillin-binding transpeptidase domain-containing protein n=1 Tax=Alloactinosynnema sp. L-07 TaxID=1653480 RepID=UPI00065EF80E|nr:penicillin-binding transpeptidase domain-containing protein [Alloactinosynnema sp. L-07]CRK58412.1 Cell division protein FtsI [Peptidoglycan synthetase] [Alloactinosynnema sp. L-07]
MLVCLGAAVYVLLPRERVPAAASTKNATQPTLTAAQVGERFLKALSAQDFTTASAVTTDKQAAASTLAGVKNLLKPAKIAATWTAAPAPAPDATEVAVPFQWAWGFGEQEWVYPSTFTLVRGDQWQVRWEPTVVHPKLAPGFALDVKVSTPDAAAVLDKDGKPLMKWIGAAPGPVDPTVAPLLTPAMKKAVSDAPAPSSRIVLVNAGAEVESLFGAEAKAAEPLKSTVGLSAQKAAQAAVDSASGPAMLVAIQPSTGGILAVAQNAAAGESPKALNGLYPPGSTFKIATAAAVLDAGTATIDTVLPCPERKTIGTRSVKNDGFGLPDSPLRTAFARSCNTTFAALAGDLPADALSASAARFGLDANFEVPGISTQTGRVKPAAGTPEQVENSIGQGTVQTSPFGVALMSATVAAGKPVTPRLFATVDTVVQTGYRAPSGATIGALRAMMREVVTSGTGKALAKYGAVAGKTGTAQFGDGSQAHGWFTGYRGDVAFAVLVEGAGSSEPAVAVTGRFLAGLG